ncbi:MAG: alkaline phosphatase family protein [Syntrophaceae bacterium]|nr:alkaline phosphatase family protein [Syntrophaceae bacterium]
MKLFKRKTKKALIIGIDGVPYSLLNTYLQKDVMPNLKEILSQGLTLHQTNASIPDISSVSWTSFNTGVNPGEHGIFGFTDLRPQSYSLYFPNSKDVKAPTFWEILAKTNERTSTLFQKYQHKMSHPYRSIVLNVPHTYPALPMNGILVSGFVAIDLKKATFPESAYAYLQSIDYLIDVEAEKAKEDKAAFMKSLFECFDIRKKAISHFFGEESWDLFFACITETDRLHHFFFDASNDDKNPYHESFIRFYIELDKFIKYLYEQFLEISSDKGFLMILSDHGFAPVQKEVYINKFLEEKGFLLLKSEGNFYERIENETRAFNLDPCRIYIHSKEAFPGGTVKKEERAALLEELKMSLRGLRGDNGDEVIDQIYEKEEIYHGPHTHLAPDLICLPKEGYDLKGSLEKKQIFGDNIFKGMHTWGDAFCILPETIRFSKKPSVENLTEYILQYYS